MIITDELLVSIVQDYRERLKSSSYSKYLHNKRVVIVGPDDRLIGKGKGDMIDSYDVVIRFNTAIEFMPFKAGLIPDIGRRTDVIYQCPSSMRILVNNQKLLDKCIIWGGLKFINYQNGNKENNYIQSDVYCYNRELDILKRILAQKSTSNNSSHNTNKRVIKGVRRDNSYKKLLYLDVGRHKIKQDTTRSDVKLYYCHETCKILSEILSHCLDATEEHSLSESIVARTGFLAIWDALLHGAKEIRIEGMSFYNGGGHMFRKIKAPLEPLKTHDAKVSPHNSLIELKLFEQLRKLFPIIIYSK